MQPFNKFLANAGKVIKKELLDIIAKPIAEIITDSSKEIVTTVGSYVVETLLGKFQKSIQIGIYDNDFVMEEAFYAVMRRYNKIEEDPKLMINNFPPSRRDLDDNRLAFAKGYHNLKYKKWNIILIVEQFTETKSNGMMSSMDKGKTYTLISFDFQNQFVKSFKNEILEAMKTVTKSNPFSKYIPIYSPVVSDSQFIAIEDRVYFNSVGEIPRRPKDTVFISDSQLQQIENIVGKFISNKNFYMENSIPYALNILLYGPPGTGKDTVIKMIASIYNRSLIYLEDNKGGINIPGMLTSRYSADIENPIFVISDIDKYPALISEVDVDLGGAPGVSLSEQITNKGLFGKMINALDGVCSLEGRIVIMTTNYVEKFDKTFLRDGRIGLKIELGYVTNETFTKFFKHYFKNVELPEKFTLKNKELTIATLQSDIIAGITSEDFLKKYLRKSN